MIILKALSLALVLAVTTSLTPQIHNLFLRGYVGGKTFKVLDSEGTGGGSGFLVEAPSGTVYVLSNAHVCEPMYGGLVTLENPEGIKINSVILDIDEEHDLCLIKAPEGLSGLSINYGEPDKGTLIHSIGYPLLGNLSIASGEVLSNEEIDRAYPIKLTDECEGTIEDHSGTFIHFMFGVEALCVYQELATLTSNTVYPGNSGSPTVDGLGRVVGVIYMGHRENIHLSYSVPVSAIHRFLKDK